jgi:D-alanyl-D-alanine carboxypeptidase/D-alanyl-D-alanine-endopeptidase (penicillin-binding protein 4)
MSRLGSTPHRDRRLPGGALQNAGWKPAVPVAPVVAVGLALAFALPHRLASQSAQPAPLHQRLSNHLAQPKFSAAAWGVKIVSLDSGNVLFEHHAGKLLKPASNAKLYTTALAFDRLGPNFRIKTSLLARSGPSRNGTLRGDLVVFGRGDPSFAARFHRGAHTNLLAPLVAALKSAGVRRVAGELVGDESFFRGPPLGTEWTWDDLQYYYGAEVSALTVEDNTVNLLISPGPKAGAPCRITTLPATDYLSFDNRSRTVAVGGLSDLSLYRPIGENRVYVHGQLPVGSTNWIDEISVHQPALWFVTLLRGELARAGIEVSGRVRAVNWLDREARPEEARGLVEIGSVESPPLTELATRTMKPSQNLYAQLLLLQVGATRHGPTNLAATTEAFGLAEMREFLAGAGIGRNEVLLEEGSGLSRGALVTPNATVKLLQFMDRHRHSKAFRDTLPIAGVDGTLRRRMKDTAAFENARAKTGTLRSVNTLSGYVTTKAGERLVFSLMLNNYDGSDARADLDAIVVMLAELSARSQP